MFTEKNTFGKFTTCALAGISAVTFEGEKKELLSHVVRFF